MVRGFTDRDLVTSHNSIINVICNEAYKKLADPAHYSCTVKSYLAEANGRIEQIAKIIGDGIILQAAAASSKGTLPESFTVEMYLSTYD